MFQTNKITMIVIASLMLAGCGKGFEAKDPNGGKAAALASNPSGGSTPTVVLPNKVATEQGEFSWQQQALSDKTTKITAELKIPFGRAMKAASRLVRVMAPYACQPLTDIQNSSPSAYNSGEIPCGQIVDSQWKQLLTATVDPLYSVEDGYNVYFYGASFPILASRAARQGRYSESDLTTKSVAQKTSSLNFGDDVSVKYTPQGNQARFEICMNLPGGTLTSTPQTVAAKAWTKVLGFKVSYDSTFDVSPGQATYDFGRACVASYFVFQGSVLYPYMKMVVTEAPHLENVNYSGLVVRINDWFLRIVDRVVSFFRTSLRKSVVAQLTNRVNNIADQDIESGAWFTKIHGQDLLDRATDKVNRRVAKVMNRLGMPTSPDDVLSILRDNCRLKKLALAADWSPRFETLCREFLDYVKVEVEPFVEDSASKAAGCYDHFAGVHSSGGAWWSQQCKLAARFSVTLPANAADYAVELRQLLVAHVSLSQIPDEWKQKIEELKIEPYTLALLLEELEKRGYTQVVPSNWTQEIPAILAQIQKSL